MCKRKEICFIFCTFLNFILFSPYVLSETCKPTEQMFQGTHFKPITQQKINIGQGLHIKGTVLSAKDCSPIENARIEHWQTNSDGKYVDELRAYLFSDANGVHLLTIFAHFRVFVGLRLHERLELDFPAYFLHSLDGMHTYKWIIVLQRCT